MIDFGILGVAEKPKIPRKENPLDQGDVDLFAIGQWHFSE